MAKCVYIYKNHTFENEQQLDDFLLEGGRELYSKLGDIVFQVKIDPVKEQLNIIDSINREVQQYQDAYQKAKMRYPDGEDDPEFKPPYKGVTGFLKGLTNDDDKLLTPEFREVEYWLNRKADWRDASKGFKSDEEELFGKFSPITDDITKDELKKFLKDWDEANDDRKPLPTSNNQILQMISEVKSKWNAQGKIGTAIHGVLQKCFSSVKSGSNKGKLWMEMPNHMLKQQILNTRVSGKPITDFLNDKQIEETIKYAHNLRAELTAKFGDGLTFFPEFQVATKLGKEVNDTEAVLGIIDLLVLDKNGDSHIIDYKASPKPSFNSAKERTFWYQQGMYARMLDFAGLKMNSKTPKVMIAPIMMGGFKKVGDKFVIEHVEQRDPDSMLLDITSKSTLGDIARNIDQFIPERHRPNLNPTETSQKIDQFLEKCFPNINTQIEWDDQKIAKFIERNGGINFDNDKKKHYLTTDYNKTFEGDSEEDVREKIKKYLTETLPKNREDHAQEIINSLRKGITENTSEIEWPKARILNSKEGASPEWFKNTLGKYCNPSYEILEKPALLKYGIIAIQNKVSKQIDFVKISTEDLDMQHTFPDNKAKLLTGAFTSDAQELRKSNSLAMHAYQGNIELMTIVAAINCMPDLTKNGAIVGNIMVANPIFGQGIQAGSNEELIYNFNELSKHIEDYENNIEDIKFANRLELANNKFHEVMSYAENEMKYGGTYKGFNQYSKLITELDRGISENDQRIILNKLNELRVQLEKYQDKTSINNQSYNESEEPRRALYNSVMLAIAELKGVNFRQQVKDNSNYIESMKIHENGLQSLMLDNPGNLNNETLNLLTKIATNAYQNVREDMARDAGELRKLVKNLKKSKGFNVIKEMTFGNSVDLYSNMTYRDPDGDWLFKDWNDSSLNQAEKEFLKFTIEKINKNRFNENTVDIEQLRLNKDKRYFRVPLAYGDFSSYAQQMGGLMNAIKNKTNQLKPEIWWENMQRKIVGVFADVDNGEPNTDLFKMTNIFEKGDNPNYLSDRIDKIKEYDRNNQDPNKPKMVFEQNLETLLLKHTAAYSMKEHIDEIMPMAKAAMIHLNVQGQIGNKKLTNAETYINNYIKNKIKGESIIDPTFRNANKVLSEVKAAASFLALAFSPVSYGYQLIQGLWTDLRLIFQNMGIENTPFTFSNFLSAGKEIYRDFFMIGNNKTKCALLNEMFGINDMDTNVLADKLKSDKYGIFNFSNIAFHCASRPDYFNRMVILIAKMKQDGTWDAYSVKDGKLVYDIKKDKRFSDLIAGHGPNYEYQKQLYYTMAKQLEKENALNKDGSKFQLEKDKFDLPKAYTNQELESIKSLSDDIYGYYSHEKKSMIHATTWGALWIQMRTYWSGKKNQYLGRPGVGLRGSYKQVTNDQGELMWQIEENGKLIPVTAEQAGDKPKIPLVAWEGDWQEGILVTLCKLASWHPKDNWEKLMSEADPKLRQLYIMNLKQLVYDVGMFAMIGTCITSQLRAWDDDLLDDAKAHKDLAEGLLASGAHMFTKMVSSSFLDFNFIDSIGNPLVDWNPFAFTYFTAKLQDIWSTALGEKDLVKTVVGMSSATSMTKPFFSVLMQQ